MYAEIKQTEKQQTTKAAILEIYRKRKIPTVDYQLYRGAVIAIAK